MRKYLFAIILTAINTPVNAQQYSIKDIGTLVEGANTYGYGINAKGEVTGWTELSWNPDRTQVLGHAYLYSNNHLVDIGPVGSENSWGAGINDAGQVAGTTGNRAFIYENGVVTYLGSVAGASGSSSGGINSFGEIAGTLDFPGTIPGTSRPRAFRFQNGVMQDLGTTGGCCSYGSAINDAGVVVGQATTTSGGREAFIFDGTTMGLLASNYNAFSANSISKNGNITGHIKGLNGTLTDAYIIQNGLLTRIPNLGGNICIGTSVNNLGNVTGTCSFGGYSAAWVFKNGETLDLNSLIGGASATYALIEGRGINDVGQILVNAEIKGTGVFRTLILTPTTAEKPTVSYEVSGKKGMGDWYTGDVSVTWLVDDRGNPEITRVGCDTETLSVDTGGRDLVCTVTTSAGSTTNSVLIMRDATPPEATATPSPLPNAAGWNNGSVSVAFTGTDATSGIAQCSASAIVATEGAVQTSTSGTCTDNAGNVSASVTYSPINIDLTPPSVGGSRSPAANAAGWNNMPVTVSFAGTDALSGVAADGCSAPQTLSASGAGQSATGACTDRAGNTASTTVAGINIDTVAPVAYASVSPAANAANWHRTQVTISFAGTDSLSGSGLAGCSTAAIVATDGAGQTHSGSCMDVAGNSSASASATVNLDQTAPTISVSAPANGASYTQNAVVNANYSCSDALSGVIGCLGTVPSGNAISTSTVGANTFTVQATDLAGNGTSQTVSYTVTVPAPFTLSPTVLGFGNQALNTSTSQVVTVRNNTAAALALTAPTLSGTNANQFTLARTCRTSLAANASCTITVTFKPTAAGPKSAAFSIRIGTTTQSVALSGTGVAATYTLSPTAITFPNTTRNTTSASQRITVANTSVVAMPLTTIALGGTNANQFVKTQTCGTSLAANSSCSVDVVFRPTSAGIKNATLTVTPGGGATAKSVTLKGSGL